MQNNNTNSYQKNGEVSKQYMKWEGNIVAKKRHIGNIYYIPVRLEFATVNCMYCQRELSGNRITVFRDSTNDADGLICIKCINKKSKTHNDKLLQNAIPFDRRKPLYIGLENHSCRKVLCNADTNIFQQKCAIFSLEGKKNFRCIYECTKCGAHLIDWKEYNDNRRYYMEYNLVNSSNMKPIKPFATAKFIRPQIKEELEATSQEQWAAKHPYQGGGVSGK